MTAPIAVVVSGSETVRLRLRLMLEAEGAEVRVAADAEAAVRAASDPSVRLAVVDSAGQGVAFADGVPVLALGDRPDWDAVRRSVRRHLAFGPGEDEALKTALSTARILVVDDSVTYREYLRLELGRLGCTVQATGDPDLALAQLETGAWNCLLVDLVMPGFDGLDLARRAAGLRRHGGVDFVVVVLTSRETAADLVRSLEAGADQFVPKSQDIAVLRVRLGALLRRKALTDAQARG